MEEKDLIEHEDAAVQRERARCHATLDLWGMPSERRVLRGKLHSWFRCRECGAVRLVKGTVPPSIVCGAERGVQSVTTAPVVLP